MSDYIKRQDVIDIIDKEMMRTITFAEHETQANIEDSVLELPTISETEIIRKAFERVVERLEEYRNFEDNDSLDRQCIDRAIEIVKEVGGIE